MNGNFVVVMLSACYHEYMTFFFGLVKRGLQIIDKGKMDLAPANFKQSVPNPC